MAWEFETDPAFQKELDWIAEFVKHEIEPLEHALFDLPMQKIGINRPERAPVKLTPHGIQA